MNEWNRKAAAITGYSTAEMLGRVLVDAEVIKTEFRTSFAEVLTLAMQGISTDNFELPLYARDGSRVELLLNATTRKDARGEVVAPLAGPLRWAVDVNAGASVRIEWWHPAIDEVD